jgi:hypothetical protein
MFLWRLQTKMTTLIDGLNPRLCEILNGNISDVHGHKIIFEKKDLWNILPSILSSAIGSML